jgi:hypothetical protein
VEIICFCVLPNLAYPNDTSAMALPTAVTEQTNPEKFVVNIAIFYRLEKVVKTIKKTFIFTR